MAQGYVDNPEKRSTPFGFFIVIGRRYTAAQLRRYEAYYKLRYTPYQKRTYETLGEAPNLDGAHTVFGLADEHLDQNKSAQDRSVKPIPFAGYHHHRGQGAKA